MKCRGCNGSLQDRTKLSAAGTDLSACFRAVECIKEGHPAAKIKGLHADYLQGFE